MWHKQGLCREPHKTPFLLGWGEPHMIIEIEGWGIGVGFLGILDSNEIWQLPQGLKIDS